MMMNESKQITDACMIYQARFLFNIMVYRGLTYNFQGMPKIKKKKKKKKKVALD